MDQELFVLDTETASLEGGVCDIAIARLDADLNIIWQDESLIDPERPISPSASGIHHITDKMVWDKPTLSEYMTLKDHPLQTPNPILCGHNVQFDIRMLGEHTPLQHRRICTLKLARLLWPEAADHKLQTLRYTFDLDAGTAHRAMGDVLACVNLLRLVRREFGLDIDALLELLKKPLSLDTRMTFGKHKGEKLKDIPLNYVRWLLEKADVDPDLRAALAVRLA